MRYPTQRETELLRHTLGIGENTRRSNWGYRNYYAPSEDSIPTLKEMQQAGFVRPGFEYRNGLCYYHATALGCSVVGMTEVETARVLGLLEIRAAEQR